MTGRNTAAHTAAALGRSRHYAAVIVSPPAPGELRCRPRAPEAMRG